MSGSFWASPRTWTTSPRFHKSTMVGTTFLMESSYFARSFGSSIQLEETVMITSVKPSTKARPSTWGMSSVIVDGSKLETPSISPMEFCVRSII